MKPYFETTGIKVYHADCMEFMKDIPDNYFELAIVDPPYGIGESGGRNASRGRLCAAKNYKEFAGEDKEPASRDYFSQLMRISKSRIIWGANHFIENMPNANASCWVVWDKDNGASDFADSELALTSFSSAVRNFRFKWQGMLQENMKDKEKRIHPTQKPVALYRWLLKNYANEGDKIFDSHLGSGSNAIAAHQMGFDFTGVELDERYVSAACKRIENEVAQRKLF